MKQSSVYGPWSNGSLSTPQFSVAPGGKAGQFEFYLARVQRGAIGLRGGAPLSRLYARDRVPPNPKKSGVRGLSRGDTYSVLRPFSGGDVDMYGDNVR